MTITREQLELAALASGHKIYGWCVLCDDRIAYADIGPEESVAWRPHTDIADAARLALKLLIGVDPYPGETHAYTMRQANNNAPWHYFAEHNGTEPDKERAYCHAITLCAAEIGRRMKGGA